MSECKGEAKAQAKDLAFTEGELAKAASKVNTGREFDNVGLGGGADKATVGNCAELYEKHNGNIEAIYKELGENPRKALKYPPANAAEFGRKYAEGFYECL